MWFFEILLDIFCLQFGLGTCGTDAVFDEAFVDSEPCTKAGQRFQKMKVEGRIKKGLILLEDRGAKRI